VEENEAMHTKWEYEIQSFPVESQVRAALNQLGKDGWELIHIDGTNYFFKRERLDDPRATPGTKYTRDVHQTGHSVG
jgi:hypothetical protein